MTLVLEIASNAAASAWTDITDAMKRDGSQFGGMAHDCEVGTGSGFDLDDDVAAIDLPTRRVVRATETATSPDTVIFRGRMTDKGSGRGQMPIGDARQFDVSLDDANSHLRGIVVDGWKRPAEDASVRVLALHAAFLNGSPRASTDLATTYVTSSGDIELPKQTYEQTDPAGVLQDICRAAGKEAFVTEDAELYYGPSDSTDYAAGLSITDDDPDLETEFPPIWDNGAPGTYEGNEFYTGVLMRYGKNKKVTRIRADVEEAHDHWRTSTSDSTGALTIARRKADTILDNQARDEFRAACSILLPAEKIDLVKPGHTLSFRAAAAGVLEPITLRVGELYREPTGDGTLYLVHMQLGTPEKVAPRVQPAQPQPDVDPFDPGGADAPGITDDFERDEPVGQWGVASSGVGDWARNGGNTNTVDPYVDGSRGVVELFGGDLADMSQILPYAPSDFTEVFLDFTVVHDGAGVEQIYCGMGGPGDVSWELKVDNDTDEWTLVLNDLGGETTDTFSAAFTVESDPVSVHVWIEAGNLNANVWVGAEPGSPLLSLALDGGDDPSMSYFRIGSRAAGNHSTLYLYWLAIEGVGDAGNDTAIGQDVNGELVFTGDSSEDTGVTSHPYMPGSLRVYLDGVREFAFSESDPPTGEFVMTSPPGTGVDVRVDYRAA